MQRSRENEMQAGKSFYYILSMRKWWWFLERTGGISFLTEINRLLERLQKSNRLLEQLTKQTEELHGLSEILQESKQSVASEDQSSNPISL